MYVDLNLDERQVAIALISQDIWKSAYTEALLARKRSRMNGVHGHHHVGNCLLTVTTIINTLEKASTSGLLVTDRRIESLIQSIQDELITKIPKK